MTATPIALVVTGLLTAPALADTLYDNGPPNRGQGGYSNGSDIFGGRRTLLDDFVIPDSQVWSITGMRHRAIWLTMEPGAGTDFELCLRRDDEGTPGDVLLCALTVSYSETATGETAFNRPEYETWYEFEPVELDAGTYWIEGAVVGPENNFWLSMGAGNFKGSECWINYDDRGGLQRGSGLFGDQTDLNFRLTGTRIDDCPADLDGSGTVGFEDILAILAAWGECPNRAGCPEDLDDDGTVGFSDLLIVLAAWGPCLE